MIIIWGETYIHEPTRTVFRAYPLLETAKALGIMVLNDAKEIKQQMREKYGSKWKREYEDFLKRHQFIDVDDFCGSYEPSWWFPKSQVKFDNRFIVIPEWLAKKYNLHQVKIYKRNGECGK